MGSTGSSSSQIRLSKGKHVPFRRCYCGLSAPFLMSTSDKNPGRWYFGCRYFLDKKEDCGYFKWYDEEASPRYKEILNEWKPNKKPSSQQLSIGNRSELLHLRVIIGFLVILVVMLVVVLCLLLKG